MGENLGSDGGRGLVLIVGAGCTGLAIAQGLKKNSIPFILLEREPQNVSRARDWNMGLHWGAPVLSTLIPPQSFAKLESAQVDPHRPCPEVDEIKFFHGETGDQLGGSKIPHLYRVRRRALRAIMAEGLDVGSEVLYDRTVVDISYSDDGEAVTAHFEDGTSVTGSCLIGADGPRSQVRQLLVGEESAKLQTLPFCATIVQAKYTAEQVRFLRSLHPLFVVGLHPEGFISWVGLHHAPSPSDPENWIMNHYISWRCDPAKQEEMKHWTNEQHLKHVKELAKKFCDPYRSAYEWLPEDQTVWWAPLTHWDPSETAHRWNNRGGRVTLAGDAAHPMTFQRGQGLNSAFKDASELVNQITTFLGKEKMQTRQAAVDAYEKEMIDRTGNEVRLSAQNTRMVHIWEEALQSPLVSKGFAKTE